MSAQNLFEAIGAIALLLPFALFALLGMVGLTGRRLSERTTTTATQIAVVGGLTSSLAVLAFMLVSGARSVRVDLGDWFSIPEQHLHFHIKFLFDRLSVPLVVLTYFLCGTVGAFASRYLHREEGFARFFFLYAVFLFGMCLSTTAGTIETLFFGWELVGLSSALLVAFFQERRSPAENGLRIWGVYRFADAAFLGAALLLHHLGGAGDFEALAGAGPWPESASTVSTHAATAVGLLLLIAAAGKSALVPFSGWLPRAMEGPTPSSAIFYGALSVHLGAYLLLRCCSLLEASVPLRVAVIVAGLTSAGFGAVTARVQTDIKSALAFASLTQVGLIVAEIGLGFRYLALVHIVGHACIRTLQLIRAPSLIHDHHAMENALGGLEGRPERSGLLPKRARDRLYALALARGHLDDAIDAHLVDPFVRFFRKIAELEDRLSRDEPIGSARAHTKEGGSQ